MSCFCPMVARLQVGEKTNLGKPVYKISARYDGVKENLSPGDKVVPCGQCLGCRLEYSRQWANRMMCEMEYHDTAYFLTLTYNDGHVPQHWYADQGTGEAFESLSLEPDDLKLFLKRLRRNQEYHGNDKQLSFFACGEYGGENHRPHYHLIVYDAVFPDLQDSGKSHAGEYKYYRSETLDKLWSAPAIRAYIHTDKGKPDTYYRAGDKSPIGIARICNVSWETCAYVARYILKKQKGDAAVYYDDFNLVPEFTRMSLKPAIGKRYYDDHDGEIYEYDKIYLKTAQGGKSFRPPSYYDKLFDVAHHEQLQGIKHQRTINAQKALEAKLKDYSGSYFDFLAAQEKAMRDRAKKLQRSIERSVE